MKDAAVHEARHSIAIDLPGPAWLKQDAVCIDTATNMASLALVQQGEVVAEQTWRSGMAHTRQLAPALRRLAEESGFSLQSVHMICVCTGPGSFNGIRTGIATALGLATALNVPVYGCGALDLLAIPHADRAPAQRAVLPAGRGEYYSALFGTRGGRWRRLSPYMIGDLRTLAAESPSKCVWCGPLDVQAIEELTVLLGGAKRLVPPAHNVRRAAYMMPIALTEAASGNQGPLEAVQPLYLRRPAITTPRAAVIAGA